MAALLDFLPQEERIITASGMEPIEDAAAAAGGGRPVCLLAHEVGAGSWYGYIWGESARAFLIAGTTGARIVTTLHADNPVQVREVFARCGIGLEQAFSPELQLFIQRIGRTPQRRVTAIYTRTNGRMRPVFQWSASNDVLEAAVPVAELITTTSSALETSPDEFEKSWTECTELLGDLRRRKINTFGAVAAALANPGETPRP